EINSVIERKTIFIRRINNGSVTIQAHQNNIIFENNINNNVSSIVLSNADYGIILRAKNNTWYIIQKISYNSNTNNIDNSNTNSNGYGYVCGGDSSNGYVNYIERFQFSFDSVTVENKGSLSIPRISLSANNSSIYGYVCSGYNNGVQLSVIDRFQFPFDNGDSIHVGNLIIERFGSAANNSSLHGYVCGGYSILGYLSVIERFQFPFDSGN
ncbi:MAG: hypothetical protein QXW35_04540, partial [Candidatus Aenigmatarchaeota archaeon]